MNRGNLGGGGLPAMLEELDLMQHFVAIEGPDVPRLGWGQAAYGPAQVDEVRLDRMCERVHSDLFGQSIAFPRIARAAGRDDVPPLVRAAAREWDEMVARESFAH